MARTIDAAKLGAGGPAVKVDVAVESPGAVVAPVGGTSTPSPGGAAGQLLETLRLAKQSARQQSGGADGGGAAADGGSGNGVGGNAKGMEVGGRKYDESDGESGSESDEHASQDGSQEQGGPPAAEEYMWITSRGEVKDMRKMSVTTLKDTVSIDIESTVQAGEENLKRRGRSVARCIKALHNTETLTFDGPGGEAYVQEVFKGVAALFQDYAGNEEVLKVLVKANELFAAQYIDLPRNLKAANVRKAAYDELLADKVAAQEALRKEKEKAKVAKEKELHEAKVAAAAKRKMQDGGGKRSVKKVLMLK